MSEKRFEFHVGKDTSGNFKDNGSLGKARFNLDIPWAHWAGFGFIAEALNTLHALRQENRQLLDEIAEDMKTTVLDRLDKLEKDVAELMKVKHAITAMRVQMGMFGRTIIAPDKFYKDIGVGERPYQDCLACGCCGGSWTGNVDGTAARFHKCSVCGGKGFIGDKPLEPPEGDEE